MSALRLLAGPDVASGAESLDEHVRRLGHMPAKSQEIVSKIERARLTGRGGAAFPVALKWRSVAARSQGAAVIIANGAEGEPQSHKDQVLMSLRPHLILDGAFLAAAAVGAPRIVVLVGGRFGGAWSAMARALAERPAHERSLARMVPAPNRYVAGESSAAVHLVDSGVATPITTPPQPHDHGVEGHPTLVQNVETLAHVALVARGGDARSFLVTAGGGVRQPGVLEIEAGSTVGDVVTRAGGLAEPAAAVLLGGYFGSWIDAAEAWELPLEPTVLRARGFALGCGVVAVLPGSRCGVCETARIMGYLAAESSAQCGPCFFGLRALADACGRIAEHGTNAPDIARLRRWAIEVRGRGACRHPDGAVTLLRSALETFSSSFAAHPHHRTNQAA